MSTAAWLMSFEEFEQLPASPGKHEIDGGEHIHHPPPEKDHSRVASRVAEILFQSPVRRRVRVDNTGYRIGGGQISPRTASIISAPRC